MNGWLVVLIFLSKYEFSVLQFVIYYEKLRGQALSQIEVSIQL